MFALELQASCCVPWRFWYAGAVGEAPGVRYALTCQHQRQRSYRTGESDGSFPTPLFFPQVEIVKYQHPEGSVSKYSIALSSASLTDLGTRDSRWRSLVSPSLNPGLPAQQVLLDILQVCTVTFFCFLRGTHRRVPFGCVIGNKSLTARLKLPPPRSSIISSNLG